MVATSASSLRQQGEAKETSADVLILWNQRGDVTLDKGHMTQSATRLRGGMSAPAMSLRSADDERRWKTHSQTSCHS